MQLRHTIGRVTSGLATLLWIMGIAGAITARAQQSPVMPNDIRKQLNQPANSTPPAATKVPATAVSKAAPASPKRVSAAAKAAPAAAKQAAATAGAAQATPAVHEQGRRDPFEPLLAKDAPTSNSPDKLPPGKAGLMVSTLRVDGIVRGPSGMIVIVSNPQERVYFLREGDRLYDGQVEKVDMSGVTFHETGLDAFGKPVEREVAKRLYPTPGEQQ